MSIYSLPPFLSVITTLVFAFLLYQHADDVKLKRYGIGFCLTVVWWQACYTVLFSCDDGQIAALISRLSYTGIVFLPPFFGQFILFSALGKTSSFLKYSFVLSVSFLPFIWLSDEFISGTWQYYFGHYPKCAYFHLFHIAHSLIVVVFCLSTLIYHLNQNQNRRAQIRSAFISFLLFVFTVFDYLVKHGLEFYPIGWLSITAALGYTLYKIFFSSFADLSILTEQLALEVKKEKKKQLYLLKIFTHDIKNRIVSGMLALQRTQTSTDYKSHIRQAMIDQHYLNQMVGNLVSVLSDEKIVLEKRELPLDVLVRMIKREWVFLIKNANIEFEMSYNAPASATVVLDERYMKLVWDNLFSNILQNTPPGGSCGLNIDGNDRWVIIGFTNTGDTIPEEHHHVIFEKYLRPEAHTPYNKGLGLNYCKMMVEKHGGRIRYDVPTIGLNRFTLSLPKNPEYAFNLQRQLESHDSSTQAFVDGF